MTLHRDFSRYIERAGDKTIPATLGKKESDGTYTMDVPGNRGFVFVTYAGSSGFGGTFGVARGFKGGTPGMPVQLKVRNGIGEIVNADYDQLPVYAPGTNSLPSTVPYHTHAIGSGMVGPVEGMRFLPGLVHPVKVAGVFGLEVKIEPFFYKYNGELQYFAGQVFDLTAYVPGTANKKAWVIVGLDPTTNTPTAQTLTEYALPVTMTPSMMNSTTFGGDIPLGAVVLKNAQTAINNLKEFADVRTYVSSATHTGTITLAANHGWPTTTLGCAAAAQTEHVTHDINLITLDFDASTNEFAQWTVFMPDDWDGGTVTAAVTWTAASSSGDVIWGIQGRAYADDDAIDQALGTGQSVTDTLTAVGDVCVSAATSAITLAGTPAAGQLAQFGVYRNAAAGGDTLAADARLIAVKLTYSKG